MVIAPNIHEYQPDGTYEDVTQQMIGIGIVSGAGGPYDHANWRTSGPVEIDEPSPGIYNDAAVNYFTAILDPSFPSDDGDPPKTNPNDPESCNEGESTNCIPCAVFNSNNECIVTLDVPSEYDTGRTSAGDKLTVDGLVSLQPIPNGSVGQTFLLAFRKIHGRNILYRWVEIVLATEEYELVSAPDTVELPGTINELIDSISGARSCDVGTPGLDIAEAKLTAGWGSDECGFDPISEPPQEMKKGKL